jgi:hypothetical protein
MDELDIYAAQRKFAMRVIKGDIPTEDFPRTLADIHADPVARDPIDTDPPPPYPVPDQRAIATDLYTQLLMSNEHAALVMFVKQPRTYREHLYAGLSIDAKRILDKAFPCGPMHPDLYKKSGKAYLSNTIGTESTVNTTIVPLGS